MIERDRSNTPVLPETSFVHSATSIDYAFVRSMILKYMYQGGARKYSKGEGEKMGTH